MNNLASLYLEMDDLARAAEYAEASLSLAHQLDSEIDIVQALGNLGIIYRRQNRWKDAIRCLDECLAIFRRRGERRNEGHALVNLGNLYRAQHRYEEALTCYEQDLSICREVGDRHGKAQALNNIGLIQSARRRWR